jgi:hypothetical protein
MLEQLKKNLDPLNVLLVLIAVGSLTAIGLAITLNSIFD